MIVTGMYGAQRIDHELARRRRAARRDHHETLQVERLLGIRESRRLVQDRPDLVVVNVVQHHLAVGARAANQAGEMNRHVDEAAAVVAKIEHQLGGAGRLQRRERIVQARRSTAARSCGRTGSRPCGRRRRTTRVSDTVGMVTRRFTMLRRAALARERFPIDRRRRRRRRRHRTRCRCVPLVTIDGTLVPLTVTMRSPRDSPASDAGLSSTPAARGCRWSSSGCRTRSR